MKLDKKQIAEIAKVSNLLKEQKTVTKNTALEVVKFKPNGDMIFHDLYTSVTFKNINIINASTLMDRKHLNKVLPLFPEFITEVEHVPAVTEVVDEVERTVKQAYDIIRFLSPDKTEKMTFNNDDDVADFPTILQAIKEVWIRDEPPQEYPKHKEDVNCEYEVHDLGVLDNLDILKINEALKYISTDTLRPAMCGVQLVNNRIYGTDAHQMYYSPAEMGYKLPVQLTEKLIKLINLFDDDSDKLEMSYWLDKMTEEELFNFNKEHRTYPRGKEYEELQARIGYLVLENHSVRIVHRKCDEFHPNYEDVIPQDSDKAWRFRKSDLLPIINKAMMVCNQVTYQISFKPDFIERTILVEGKDEDLQTDYVKLLTAQDMELQYEYQATDDQWFSLNGRLLLKLFANMGEEIEVKFSSPLRAFLFNDYMLMMPLMRDYKPKN